MALRRGKKTRLREEREEEILREVKDGKLVYNLSSVVIPDCAYLFLSLGSSFVPSKIRSKHDDVYDIIV